MLVAKGHTATNISENFAEKPTVLSDSIYALNNFIPHRIVITCELEASHLNSIYHRCKRLSTEEVIHV